MNKFIVIDGLDGCGKDTQVNLLAEVYRNQGRDVTIRSHPCNDNKYGRKSKQALLKTGKINHLKATIYFGLDALRSVHMYYYNKDTDVLIFSRYTMAVAYLPNVVNVIVYKIVSFALPKSDCMFFLDVTPEESLRRIQSRKRKCLKTLMTLERHAQKLPKLLMNGMLFRLMDLLKQLTVKY